MSETEELPEYIYHLVLKNEFIPLVRDNYYLPLRFQQDKFIHCTQGEDLTIIVANDYFSGITDLLVLKIRLKAIHSPVTFEKPIPIPGGKKNHLIEGVLFPHIYGPLNLDAIEGIGILPKINYVFHFPKKFISYTQLKEGKLWN
ncbi:MAG TPA: DUF952 domain-containing protein [Leptospiraceae bacterium]|nr:DUF952 domain-containing protein [Leptospiraceae bacterium]HMW07524.1 DUF952 domain-containing protein [Leptospiraceae bacterium]HMX33298.1 DUF952 domain-containing protein [Leptospiraceae bacterium]HMY33175.1 DUF952 domain-containing protein [Leptospiraceae bacterium]HMZ67225.1 DUF952 domain-containing protein [Leptospiraceae bacterium]